MNIRNQKEITAFAARRVADNPNVKKVVLIYGAISLGVSTLVALVSYVLGLQIDQYGGLSNLGTKTILSSIQFMLPIVVNLFTMCLELGYLAAVLRVARGQYVSPQTLRLGFDRFWVLLRCTLIKSLMILSGLFLSVYLGIMAYMLTPLSEPAVEILLPYLSALNGFDAAMLLDETVYQQFALAVWPAYLFCGGFALLLVGPMVYSYRMASYVIIDKPALGALAALRASKSMMRGNRISLLKLDLRLAWWYLALVAANLLGYGDVILPMLGAALPGHVDIWYFVFLVAYMAVLFALTYFLRSRVEAAYCLAYDAVKPAEKQDNGVVLGNIFQM